MKITALEIKQHEFEKSFRGYNIEEVDIFLNNIASEWERTSNESKMLRMQLEIAEKEATKLREVEMSLIKTLQNAESTSNKITEHAQSKANAQLESAKIESETILAEAQAAADKIRTEAEQYAQNLINKSKASSEELLATSKATSDQLLAHSKSTSEHLQLSAETTAKELTEKAKKDAEQLVENTKIELSENHKKQLEKEGTLKEEISALENYKGELIAQLRAFTSNTIERLQHIAPNAVSADYHAPVAELATTESEIVTEKVVVNEVIVTETIEEIATVEAAPEYVEETEEVLGFASSANNMTLTEEVEQINEAVDDLTHIEGIGPKIAEILASNGVTTYRELAITPYFKIKNWLEEAGSNYAMHDPKSWPEQAMLAGKGEWDELDALKDRLIAGKEPKKEATPVYTKPAESLTNEQNTEEMLDRVNKVKAALKKAMQEKEGTAIEAAPPIINVISTENTAPQKEEGGSFFDSLN